MATELKGAKKAEVDKERREQLKRVQRKTILFNNDENKMIEGFCKRFGIKNRTKMFREAIMATILQKMEQDHPKLF